jgi:hypothetical protein
LCLLSWLGWIQNVNKKTSHESHYFENLKSRYLFVEAKI